MLSFTLHPLLLSFFKGITAMLNLEAATPGCSDK
jgi:hypothetical protein